MHTFSTSPSNSHTPIALTVRLSILLVVIVLATVIIFRINDSLALVAADTSIAVSFAVDVAQAAADIVITSKSEDLGHAVFTSLTLATINRWHIKAALSWSVVYNILAILLASGAFVNIRIQPEWAGLGEIVSILPVIFIAFAVRITWRSRQITWLLRPLQSVSSGEPSGEG